MFLADQMYDFAGSVAVIILKCLSKTMFQMKIKTYLNNSESKTESMKVNPTPTPSKKVKVNPTQTVGQVKAGNSTFCKLVAHILHINHRKIINHD